MHIAHKISIILFLFSGVHPVYAQDDCNSKDSFIRLYSYAKNELTEQKCVQIDVTASYDSAGANLELHWDLGDGEKDKGLQVKHCYHEFGFYQAKLSILSQAGDTISANEMTLDIVIKEAVSLFMDVPDTVAMDSAFSPGWRTSELLSYHIENIYFDFGDNSYACVENASHSYEAPGFYTIRMLMVLSAADGEFYLKAEKKIFVEGFNLSGKELCAYFDDYNESLEVNYLNEPVRISLTALADQKIILTRELSPGSDFGLIPPLNTPAWLFIWRANHLMKPMLLPAATDSVQGYMNILNLINEHLEVAPLTLKPVYFKLNETKPDPKNKKVLKENIKLLQSLPEVVVKIGSHTHSGGMRGIAEAYALTRSEYLKTAIGDVLGDKVEAFIDSVQTDPSLINTCFDDPECAYENEELNGRSDIKIIAIGTN